MIRIVVCHWGLSILQTLAQTAEPPAAKSGYGKPAMIATAELVEFEVSRWNISASST